VTDLSRILCAVDFSQPAKAAFQHALALSQAHNAELTIVHVVEDKAIRWLPRKAIAALSALVRAAENKGVRVNLSVQHGDPADVIVLHASARPFDLVVLGTHQRTGLERFKLGSVAERVSERSARPVVVVPALDGETSDLAKGPFRNVLCPIDFTSASAMALEQALPIAERSGGRLTLLHVLEGLAPKGSPYGSHVVVPEYRHLRTREAWQQLQAAIPVAARASGAVHARVVTGSASDAIVRVATDTKTDLIVVGTTPRRAIRRLFGSTATRVLRRAGCAVLTVPDLGHGAPRTTAATRAAA
jgi:nucleotide-binding universal stress UspA family protein